jgi:hypothetical protein
MTLTDYLDGMRGAATATDLEAAIQAPFKHSFRGPTWSRICNTRIEAGNRICLASPNGKFVPMFGPRRKLTLCGHTYGVGYGQNSSGERYVWTYAEEWAVKVLREHGFGVRASHLIWDNAGSYPHRALQCIEEALAGQHPDPPMNRLIYVRDTCDGMPVRVDRRYESKHRAHRPCRCGGTRWDWGSGYSLGITFVHWYCDGCPRVYEEHVTEDRFAKIRSQKAA